jgi:FkbM family methyltransferase
MTNPVPTNPSSAADAAAKAARRAAPMFADQPTLDRYLACLFDTDRTHAPVEVRCVATGNLPLLMRPGTTDARVLDDTFIGLYHLPPAPLPDDAIILDLGANVGYTAVHFATLYPRARIVSVELDEGSADLARRNTAAFADRISVLHAAAWFEDSTVTYTTGDEWGLQVREQWAGTPEHARPAHATGARVISVPALSACRTSTLPRSISKAPSMPSSAPMRRGWRTPGAFRLRCTIPRRSMASSPNSPRRACVCARTRGTGRAPSACEPERRWISGQSLPRTSGHCGRLPSFSK